MKAFTSIKVALLLGLLMTASGAWGGEKHSDDGSLHIVGTLLTSGLAGSIGGTIGPDGALYVAEGAAGDIARVDLSSGDVTTFASGLPAAFPFVGIGGPIDVAFIGKTAFVLVTLVGDPLFRGTEKDGIYRVNHNGSSTLVADIGQFSSDNPPPLGTLNDPPSAGLFNYFLVNGVQYALQPIEEGFLVSDGHLNRVLRVSQRGEITVLKSFGDVVPTGIAVAAGRVYLAELGPSTPNSGKVVSFPLRRPQSTDEVASGVSMIIDAQFGPRGKLYALSQGEFSSGPPGSPALPNTGRLLRVNDDGSFAVLADGLNQPTSLHFVCSNAYVVTLNGEVWKFKLAARDEYCRDGRGEHD